MPKKPIQPDRVRPPKEWWDARIYNIAVGVIWLAIYFPCLGLVFEGRLKIITIVLAFVFYLVVGSFVSWNELRVRKIWIRRIIKHNGLMCPQCAYLLSGIQADRGSATCPECGYLTEDTYQLFQRWRTSIKRFYWRDDKRLRNHRYNGPCD